MTVRILIDLNVRVEGNRTYAGFEHVRGSGVLSTGVSVEVLEEESGLVGQATITDIDPERELVYLEVDWSSLHEPTSRGVVLGGPGVSFTGSRRVDDDALAIGGGTQFAPK